MRHRIVVALVAAVLLVVASCGSGDDDRADDGRADDGRADDGEVAEVWLDVAEVAGETAVPVTITGARGTTERSLAIEASVMPGTDDLGGIATDSADVFLSELGGRTPGLPETSGDLVGGTPVAGLLVVSHYAWFTDAAEIGLGWHVMVAPDDWAELYIRPRGEISPTAAWRLSSWSTALDGGEVTIEEIPPPPEVTR